MLAEARQQMSDQFGGRQADYMKARLLDTIKQRGISFSEVPEQLFRPFPARVRKELLRKHGNGHDRSIGIPLDAIPERAPKASKAPSKHDPFQHKRTHPNAELIGKIVDLLASPSTNDKVADRLLAVLDKLA